MIKIYTATDIAVLEEKVNAFLQVKGTRTCTTQFHVSNEDEHPVYHVLINY